MRLHLYCVDTSILSIMSINTRVAVGAVVVMFGSVNNRRVGVSQSEPEERRSANQIISSNITSKL